MSPKKYIVILGGIVVISAFVLIYLDSEKANTGINPSTLDPGVSLSLPGQTSTTTRVAEDVEAPLPPVPDLDRPLVFSIETPELTRSQINVRRNDLVLELKENPAKREEFKLNSLKLLEKWPTKQEYLERYKNLIMMLE